MFKASVSDLQIQGCDFRHARQNGLIDEITVMLRPLNAITVFAERMGEEFEKPWHATALPRRWSSNKWPAKVCLLPSNPSPTDTGRGAPYPASDKTALKRCVMAWLVLMVSGVLEAVWATALSKSDGFSRLVPSLIFVVSVMFSMTGLAFAMRSLPTGTNYAVWACIGAVLTVGYAMLTGDETPSPVKMVLIAGVIGCIVGLKTVS
jgi:quaternary ammonium compound-resistance protein SugE